MTFVDGFYSFSLELVDVDHNIYETVRFKTPKHPYESLEHLLARVLAYIHCFQAGQTFTRGLFETSEPTIWRKDVIGETLLWVQVGVPDKKKLHRALQHHRQAEFRVYFFEPEQEEAFCRELKGSTTNWVANVRFFRFEPKVIAELIPQLRSSVRWGVTLVDHSVYLSVDALELQTTIAQVDIWRLFTTMVHCL